MEHMHHKLRLKFIEHMVHSFESQTVVHMFIVLSRRRGDERTDRGEIQTGRLATRKGLNARWWAGVRLRQIPLLRSRSSSFEEIFGQEMSNESADDLEQQTFRDLVESGAKSSRDR